MIEKHPHAAALDGIGKALVKGHYNLTDRTWQLWRKDGVPKMHWKSLALLARVHRKPAPSFNDQPKGEK